MIGNPEIIGGWRPKAAPTDDLGGRPEAVPPQIIVIRSPKVSPKQSPKQAPRPCLWVYFCVLWVSPVGSPWGPLGSPPG
jgi:hypothetical protein